jgi:16S rRNA (uracil1498-N3)-methyltransferase
MTVHRFLVPDLPSHGAIELPTQEAHHASRVLRCSEGDAIALFDGLGHEAQATIRSIDKRSVVAAIDSYAFAPRDHAGRLHFAIALPKGDRQRNTIERLVELGVDSMCPLSTSRSVAVVNEANTERLERYVIEACKQCGRNRRMGIGATLHMQGIQAYAAALALTKEARRTSIWILHPTLVGEKIFSIHEANALDFHNANLLFVVGPEGGFSDEEVEEAVSQGARIMSLGERIQRVETAAATSAVLGHLWLSEFKAK